ncbi:hypothetical protein HPP92_001010 [Vanilla planifolia]|uniref:Uncharacterized protein n=1 Tax=Vanilla planifolia TaxID=51239 RepID=A0A835RVI3_VANPL|nr:hypothetical protein HPP92_001010 [Vanilla planifolia]
MAELVKLRQEQQHTRAHLKAMEDRLKETEQRQLQMMGFLVRAMHSPEFMQQLCLQNEKRRELVEAIAKKRRRPIEEADDPGDMGSSTAEASSSRSLLDEQVSRSCDVPQLKGELGMHDFQGLEQQSHPETKHEEELNDEFWDELLNEGIGEEASMSDVRGTEDQNVDLLAQELNHLSSSNPK